MSLTRRQGREKAYVFFGEEKSSPHSAANRTAGHAGACWVWVFVLRMRGVVP